MRLAGLEKKSAEEGLVLTETQVAALERKREEQMECGEIETAHPGYLGSQDTFYVGNTKGVGGSISRPSDLPAFLGPLITSERRLPPVLLKGSS